MNFLAWYTSLFSSLCIIYGLDGIIKGTETVFTTSLFVPLLVFSVLFITKGNK